MIITGLELSTIYEISYISAAYLESISTFFQTRTYHGTIRVPSKELVILAKIVPSLPKSGYHQETKIFLWIVFSCTWEKFRFSNGYPTNIGWQNWDSKFQTCSKSESGSTRLLHETYLNFKPQKHFLPLAMEKKDGIIFSEF